jgi:hypothetical protein
VVHEKRVSFIICFIPVGSILNYQQDAQGHKEEAETGCFLSCRKQKQRKRNDEILKQARQEALLEVTTNDIEIERMSCFCPDPALFTTCLGA